MSRLEKAELPSVPSHIGDAMLARHNLADEEEEEGEFHRVSITCWRFRWSIAQSPVLTTTITLERLAKRGYESLLDYLS
jgi:hypothetical protein